MKAKLRNCLALVWNALRAGCHGWRSIRCVWPKAGDAAFGIALLASGTASAGGLAAAIEQAWQLHPQAAAQDANAAGAQAQRDLAAAPTPKPPAVSFGSLDDRQGRNLGKQEWEVELAVPLWLPGQQAARGAVADARVHETAAGARALRLEVAGAVRAAWWSLAAARADHALAQRHLDTARALVADVQRRFKAGELARIDANLAHDDAAAAQAGLIEADATLRQAERSLQLLTGQSAPALLEAEEPATTDGGPEHPQLAAAAAAAASTQARLRLAATTSRSAPELALRVVRERGSFAEPYGNQLGIKLTVPFASAAQARSEEAVAVAAAAQADAELRRAQARAQADIDSARTAIAAAQRQLALAQERRLLADDNLRLTEKSFTLGEAGLSVLLRARAAAHAAASLHERQRTARDAAISRLNQSLGVSP